MNPPARPASTRIYELDTLRGLAAIVIMLTHYGVIPYTTVSYSNLGFQYLFVLSAFLVTERLLQAREKTGGSPWQISTRFWLRRVTRILPVFYLVLIGSLVVLTKIGDDRLKDTFGWHFFHLSNVFYTLRGDWFGPTNHLWALSSMEQFYLIWPLVLLAVPARGLPVLCLVVLAIGLVSKLIIFQVYGPILAVKTFPSCALEFFGAGALALWWKKTQAPSRSHRSAFLGITGCVVVWLAIWRFVPPDHWASILKDTVAGLGLALLIGLLTAPEHRVSIRWLQAKPLVYSGLISYGVYLFHPFVWAALAIVLFKLHLPAQGPWLITASVVTTVVLSILTYHFVERPLQERRPALAAKPSPS